MKIVHVLPDWCEPLPAIVEALEGIEHETRFPVYGVSHLPTIAALDDSDALRKEWRPDQAIDAADIATWAAMDGTPIPTPKKYAALTKLGFIRHCQTYGGFSNADLVQAKADENLAAFWIKLDMATEILRDDPDAVAGLAALKALGYFTQGEIDSILTNWPEG